MATNPLVPQPFSRSDKLIPKKAKIHPAVAQAADSWHRLHGVKFQKNAGKGFGPKKKT